MYDEEARCLNRIVTRMNKFIPKANQTVSPEVLADLKMLVRAHEKSAGLVQSLMVSKEQARVHLKFLKTMMYLTNGAGMFLGMVLAGFGIQKLMHGFSAIAIIGPIVGALLFVKFSALFTAMLRALRATEALAHKHNLI